MKRPKKMGGAKGMKPPAPPAGNPAGPMGAPGPMAGKFGGAVSKVPGGAMGGMGHKTPTMKDLTTDRGAFKMK